MKTFDALVLNSNKSLLIISCYNLEKHGLFVSGFDDVNSAKNYLKDYSPDLIVIDDNTELFEKNKLSLEKICSSFKNVLKNKSIPFIIASSKNKKSLEIKFDDQCHFIYGPFLQSKLIKKIRDLFKDKEPKAEVKNIEYKNLKMNLSSYKVLIKNKTLQLAPVEFKILQCFVEKPDKIISREHIMQYVWGYNCQIEQRTIDVHINRLRAALKNDNSEGDSLAIKTIRSEGYYLSVDS